MIDQSSILNHSLWNKQNKIHFAICDDLIGSTKGLFIGKCCTLIDDLILLFFGTINETFKFSIKVLFC